MKKCVALGFQSGIAASRGFGSSVHRSPGGCAAAKQVAQLATSMLRAKQVLYPLGKSRGRANGPKVPARATITTLNATGGESTAGGGGATFNLKGMAEIISTGIFLGATGCPRTMAMLASFGGCLAAARCIGPDPSAVSFLD